jgi:hypothetical protein
MKHILTTLAFFANNPGWQSFANDRSTKNAVTSLERRGFLEVIRYNKKNSTDQARFTGKISV